MQHTVEQVRAGSLGAFWLQFGRESVDLDAPAAAGHLRERPDGSLELSLLIEDAGAAFMSEDSTPTPEVVVGSTENGGVFLEGVHPTGSSVTIGGHRASTRRYDVETLAIDVPFQALRSSAVGELAVSWSGIGSWAGMTVLREKPDRDENGRLRGITLTLKRFEPLVVDLDDGTLELGSAWRVDGPDDARLVEAPVTITLRGHGDGSLAGPVQYAARVQDLISLAYQGRVTPSRATTSFDFDPDSHTRSRFDVWNRSLMSPGAGVKAPRRLTEVPLFYLADIGNLDGIRRWLDLSENHPLLLRPVLVSYRVGKVFTDSLLLDLGSAIDVWKGVNTRQAGRDWTNEKFQPLAVAQSVGPHFDEWVGGAAKWADHFWYHYNALKHFDRRYDYDPLAIHWLALSGQSLLTCVALQEAAGGSSDVVERVLNSHRWASRAHAVREWLATQPERPPGAA